MTEQLSDSIMKRRRLWHRYAKVLWISLLPLSALAFEDVYEPNESFEQATDIFRNSNIRQQYTLHRRDDEDWFKFSLFAGNIYEIAAYNVGYNINVALELYDSDGTLLKEKKGCCNGKKKYLNWDVAADGIYYLKVSDMAKQSDDCRLNIQYELSIFSTSLCLIQTTPAFKNFNLIKMMKISVISGLNGETRLHFWGNLIKMRLG